MNATTLRLAGIAALLLIVAGAMHWWRGGLVHDDVLMPAKDIKLIPLELGDWHGADVELDPEIAKSTGADSLVNRKYERDGSLPVTLHGAVHKNPETAVIHTPVHCYRAQAYRLLSEDRVVIAAQTGASDEADAAVEASVSTWEHSGRKVRVLYWFQWGEYGFHDRLSLGPIRLKMGGRKQWPAVIKILLETPATEDEAADRDRLVEIGRLAFTWLAENSGLPTPTAN